MVLARLSKFATDFGEAILVGFIGESTLGDETGGVTGDGETVGTSAGVGAGNGGAGKICGATTDGVTLGSVSTLMLGSGRGGIGSAR